MKKIWVILLIISLSFNAGMASIIAYRGLTRKSWIRRKSGLQEMQRKQFMHERFGISEEQLQEFRQGFVEREKQVLPLRKSLWEKRKELLAMVKSEKIDENKKEKLLKEMSGLQMEKEKIILDSIIEIKSKMGPQQKEIMDKLLDNYLRGSLDRGLSGRPGLPRLPERELEKEGKRPFRHSAQRK